MVSGHVFQFMYTFERYSNWTTQIAFYWAEKKLKNVQGCANHVVTTAYENDYSQKIFFFFFFDFNETDANKSRMVLTSR